MTTTYINGAYRGERETVDEFDTRKEARAMLQEYRDSFGPDWQLWLSQRACKDWHDASQTTHTAPHSDETATA